MPVYQYTCATCGSFEETAPISRFAEPCECPACGALSERNLLSVPQLSTLNSQARAGHMINERASDNPKRASQTGMRPTGPKIKSRARNHADGSKSMPGARPWMLSH
ncbi:MAG: FmdB family zinc ribbon protein [Pseudomonadota bacterium]